MRISETHTEAARFDAMKRSAERNLLLYLILFGHHAMNRAPRGRDNAAPLALAILLPGMAGLGWLGRKRKLFSRVALLAMVGAITVLGASACNPRYKYLNHPPTYNGGTATGDYTLTVWAQTSDGVTASEVFTTMAVTVN